MLLLEADTFAFVSSGRLMLFESISKEESFITMAFGSGLTTAITFFLAHVFMTRPYGKQNWI